jgi:hypothetical protein
MTERTVGLICLADVRTVAMTMLKKWLHHQLTTLSPIPKVYRPRVAVLKAIAGDADSLSEADKREVKLVIAEIIEELGDSIAYRRVLLNAFDFLTKHSPESSLSFNRDQLIDELDRRESKSLAHDLAID